MKVTVKLFATLRNFGPVEQEMELAEHSTLEDLIKMLKLPEKIPLLKIVNGEHRSIYYCLKEGDEIALFPPIAGGMGGNEYRVRTLARRQKFTQTRAQSFISSIYRSTSSIGGLARLQRIFHRVIGVCKEVATSGHRYSAQATNSNHQFRTALYPNM